MDLQAYFSVRSSKKRNLDTVRALLRELGNPEDRMQCIQIAGTNAKGSTAAMLALILRSAGYVTGLFTSPALIKMAERFRINGAMVSDEALEGYAQQVARAEASMNFEFGGFDRMTATALLTFAQGGVEIAVLETGLGGLLDPVTAVTPRLCFITSVSMDHMHMLGNTIEEITNQKCGIMKPYVPVVCHPQRPIVMDIIRDYAAALKCPLLEVDPSAITDVSVKGLTQSMSYRGFPLTLGLAGAYQRVNAAAAWEGAMALRSQGLAISDEAIREGIVHTLWPCRMEMVNDVLLDGAHNPAAMRALGESLKESFPHCRPVVLLSVLRDKDVGGVVRELCYFAKHVVCVRISERAADADVLSQMARHQGVESEAVADIPAGLARLAALAAADSRSLPVVAGSLYLAGAARALLLE